MYFSTMIFLFSISLFLAVIPQAVFSNSKFICEQSTSSISCPNADVIQIRSVNFGRTNKAVCKNDPNINCYSSGRVTGLVAKTCNDKNVCRLTATTAALGENPCPGTSKYLDIQYECNPPPTTTTTTTTTTTPSTTTAQSSSSSQPSSSSSSIASPNAGGPQVCHEYLISGSNGVPDNKLTATSTWSNSSNQISAPYRARLFNTAVNYGNGTYLSGGWSAGVNDKQQYIQAEFQSVSLIRGVVTQGRNVNPNDNCCHQKVTKYKVMYSVDGKTFLTVKDEKGNEVIYIGNTKDEELEVTNMFGCPILAKFLRLQPVEWSSHISLRFDVIGCKATTDPYGSCPKGWKERPGSKTCYLVTSNASAGWRQARQVCKQQQGDLVKIDSIQERDWLIQEIKRKSFSQVWIGLNNLPRRDNKNFHWTDGTQLNTNIVPWKTGNPDNYLQNEHCGEFSNAELNDIDCNSKINYICEKPKFWTNPGTSSTQAPPNSASTTTKNPGQSTTTPQTTSHVVVPTKKITKIPPTPTKVIPTLAGAKVVNGILYTAGCGSKSDCYNLGIGDHQYCVDCHSYLTCAPSGVFVRPCPANLEFDNNLQACVARSWTCRRVANG